MYYYSLNDENCSKLVKEGHLQYDSHMKWNRRLLKAGGIWPHQRHWTKLTCCLYNVYAAVALVWLTLVTTFEFFTIRDAWGNFFEVIEVASATTTSMLIIHKVLILSSKKGKIQELDCGIRGLWVEAWSQHKVAARKMMIKAAARSKYLTIAFTVPLTLTVINFSLSPILSLNQQMAANVSGDDLQYTLPYLVQFPWIDLSNPTNYALSYATTAGVSIYVVVYISGIDTFYIVYITQICLQFKLLALEIQHSVTKREIGSETVLPSVDQAFEMRFKLIKCIQKHNKLISMSGIIEELYSQIILGLCVVSTVSMCAVMFQTVVSVQHGNTIQFATYLLFEISEVLMFCWFGDTLTKEAEVISSAVYCSEWYNADKSITRDLMMVMRRAQIPIYITAYGFAVVSLELCTAIFSTTTSYFTLLRKIYYR